MYCSFRRSAQAGKGERKQGSSEFQCTSPPRESGPQPDFHQRNSGHRLRGLWRKTLQETQIPAELEISIPHRALHCQVPSHVFPALSPSPRNMASAAQQLLSIRLWCLVFLRESRFLTAICSTLHQTHLRIFRYFSGGLWGSTPLLHSRELWEQEQRPVTSLDLASWE